MQGKGKKEMGISPDEDSEQEVVVQLLAEALECNDESW